MNPLGEVTAQIYATALKHREMPKGQQIISE